MATVVLDAHTDHFGTYNLFGGSNGPYWAQQGAWNLGALTTSDYTQTITIDTTTFVPSTVMAWSYPAIPNAGNVYAYPEIVYGTQSGGFIGFPANTPLPTRINNFGALSLSYEVTRTFANDDADCLIETWTFATPDRSGGIINEIGFLAHTPTANHAQAVGFADHFDFSSGGFNAYIAATPDKSFIIIMPGTAPGGTTALDMTSGPQTINFLPLLQAIVAHGWTLGTNYLCGYEFGFEIAKNAGTATIVGLNWTWGQASPMPTAVLPTSLSLPEPGDPPVWVYSWNAMTDGAVGSALPDMWNYADRSVQVTGTFGSGGNCVIEGSNDGINYDTLTDPFGSPMSFTAAGLRTIIEVPRYIRPNIIAGDGTTNLNVIMLLRHTTPQT